jgi:hypothetical protein
MTPKDSYQYRHGYKAQSCENKNVCPENQMPDVCGGLRRENIKKDNSISSNIQQDTE